ncbi:hypothetical protein dsat_0851 [Alkalidesulfovibrio alkalitolerans DSM 16529]|jgi:hypothetical protein|uniref:Uncharacterized protein n=1 Tax=Alkalidesulfovibrio alkalitolerans DSM 16529 TaxID=1121439 RepID=S7T367_9BACT|nr:hypothetical protein [Alkalidesulfovibrio alkalitolerans]EPR31527.1 hypothetical protein dsat_0851 [Alkalidesulfovibrio alkalitolerans DSM 16529]
MQNTTVTPQEQDASPPAEIHDRLAAYLRKLALLKERGALRDVMEREMLLEFIRINKNRINEFPLLQVQQNGVINTLGYRSNAHPAHEFVKRCTATFLHLLTQYGKAGQGRDAALADSLRAQIVNNEAVLIKCAQGAVYSAALIHDNFEEALISFFGEGAIEIMDEATERLEMNDRYWKELLDGFIARRVDESHERMIREERYSLRKEQNTLVVQFPFDSMLDQIKGDGRKIEKTRVQKAFEEIGENPQGVLARKLVFEALASEQDVFGDRMTREQRLHTAAIVCMDVVAEQFLEIIKERAAAGNDGVSPEETARLEFVREQVTAMAVGCVLIHDIVRDDFTAGIGTLGITDPRPYRETVQNFEAESLYRTIHALLEGRFLSILKERLADEGGKVVLKTARARRVPAPGIERLTAAGLTRIRRAKLFDPDKERPGAFIFTSRNAKELYGLMRMLQIERELEQTLIQAWEQAEPKVDILAVINVEALAKTTTNLKGRLAEILGRLGIAPVGG